MATKLRNNSKSRSDPARSVDSKRGIRSSSSLNKQLSEMCPGFTTGGQGVVSRGSNSQCDNKRALRKFVHRVKENIGMTERTEYSKQLSDAFEQLDNYKLCLDGLNDAVCQVIQRNPVHRKVNQQMTLAPPPNQDPYELVTACLKSGNGFEDYKNSKTQVSLYEKQAVEHREYIRRARRALHNIRTFVQHDYWIIGIQRTELDNLRIEMDFAKAEVKAAKEPQLIDLKSKLYSQAVKAFQDKLKEVTKLMDAAPKNKEVHLEDVIEWTNCTRVYHEKMAKLLQDT